MGSVLLFRILVEIDVKVVGIEVCNVYGSVMVENIMNFVYDVVGFLFVYLCCVYSCFSFL